jgi:hypothetical protein
MMSLHMSWSAVSAHPGGLMNFFALLIALPGAWLLHVTRRREQLALKKLAAQSAVRAIDEPMLFLDIATLRMNRFFYRFGFVCLALALLLSWISRHF